MVRATNLTRLSLLAAILSLAASSTAGEDAATDCAQGKPLETRIRAAAYSEKANHKQAIADFTEAINLKGDDATSYFGRGESRLAEGDAAGRRCRSHASHPL
jgi:hypothetical protein